jgi:hypothetical protein
MGSMTIETRAAAAAVIARAAARVLNRLVVVMSVS